jgi:hypothetical protein
MCIWDYKRIQIKRLSSTKFYNFSRFTTFVLVKSPSEVKWKIWISNMRKFGNNFSWINYFKWKGRQLQSWITFWDLQLLFWSFLHPWLFKKLEFEIWEFKCNLHWIDDFKRKSYQLQCCRTFRKLQLLFWLLVHPTSLTITTHSLMTIERMNFFGIGFY